MKQLKQGQIYQNKRGRRGVLSVPFYWLGLFGFLVLIGGKTIGYINLGILTVASLYLHVWGRRKGAGTYECQAGQIAYKDLFGGSKRVFTAEEIYEVGSAIVKKEREKKEWPILYLTIRPLSEDEKNFPKFLYNDESIMVMVDTEEARQTLRQWCVENNIEWKIEERPDEANV